MAGCFSRNLLKKCCTFFRVSTPENDSARSRDPFSGAQSALETRAQLVQASLENRRKSIRIPVQPPEIQQNSPSPQQIFFQSGGVVGSNRHLDGGDPARSLIVPKPRTYQDPEPANLPNIPTEIVQIIVGLLPPSAVISLSYSCRALRCRISVSHEGMLGKPSNSRELSSATLGLNVPQFSIVNAKAKISVPTPSRDKYLPERLELLCLLDRDQMIPTTKKICSGCASTHENSFFSPESLLQPNHQRLCVGMAGRLWVCPHWQFDHNLITTSSTPDTSHHCGDHSVWVCFDGKRPRIIWPIKVLQDGDITTLKETVDDLLHSMNIPICKHLRFSDPFVSRLYSPDCKQLRWRQYGAGRGPPCNCSSCLSYLTQRHGKADLPVHGAGECETCGTRMFFSIAAQRDGSGDVLELNIERAVESFRGCTDHAWLQQISDPAECEEFERAWYTAVEEKTPHISDRFYNN